MHGVTCPAGRLLACSCMLHAKQVSRQLGFILVDGRLLIALHNRAQLVGIAEQGQ